MVSRIKQLLDWQQLSPTQFADRIGVGRPVVSHILSERNKPSLDVVRQIRAAFPTVSLDWLLDGIGPMLTEPAATPGGTALAQVAPAEAPPAVLPAAQPQSEPTSISSPVPLPFVAGAASLAAPAPAPAVAGVGAPLPQPAPRPAIPRFQPGSIPAADPTPRVSVEAAASWATEAMREPAVAAGSRAPMPANQMAAAVPVGPAPAPPAAEAPTLLLAEMPPAAAPVEAAPTVPAQAGTAGLPTLADVFGESGKAIRRIVIFYRDGSFADYQPEA